MYALDASAAFDENRNPLREMPSDFEPRLIADIGVTYARFVLEREPGVFSSAKALLCVDYPDFLSALREYLKVDGAREVRHGAIAIANPVAGDLVQMTNYPWRFSIEETRRAVGFETLLVVNDFTALAMGLPYLTPSQYRQVGGGTPRDRSVIGIVGAGSGLGVSGLIPVDDGWVSLASEGGHVDFSPANERESMILDFARRQLVHVSAERLISALGLELIYAALGTQRGAEPLHLDAREIARRGLAAESDLCVEALETFCEMIGTVASNVAITLGAFGGMYIAGGIVPRLGTYFDRSGFRARFESKGRLSGYAAQIPTFVITADTPTFTGTSAILSAQLKKRGTGPTLLERVRRARNALSRAERRVADFVLAQPRRALNDPIMDIAREAAVSQPTVVRFCRSLGCEGLSDFKLKLASGLSGTIPVSHTLVRRTDSALEVGAKVLDNTASALLEARDQLNSEAVGRAIESCLRARRVEFYASGNFSVVALDAQYKLLRLGVPACAYTETHLQELAAGALGEGDVIVAICGSDRSADLLKAVKIGKARGATVISIAPTHAPLGKRADIAIAVDHPEDVSTQIPMISRVLYLALIDILAVGIAMRTRGGRAALRLLDRAEDTHPGAADEHATELARATAHGI
jgi:glucokinase